MAWLQVLWQQFSSDDLDHGVSLAFALAATKLAAMAWFTVGAITLPGSLGLTWLVLQ